MTHLDSSPCSLMLYSEGLGKILGNEETLSDCDSITF